MTLEDQPTPSACITDNGDKTGIITLQINTCLINNLLHFMDNNSRTTNNNELHILIICHTIIRNNILDSPPTLNIQCMHHIIIHIINLLNRPLYFLCHFMHHLIISMLHKCLNLFLTSSNLRHLHLLMHLCLKMLYC